MCPPPPFLGLNENVESESLTPSPIIKRAKSRLRLTCGECNFRAKKKDEIDNLVKQHKATESDSSILKEYIFIK